MNATTRATKILLRGLNQKFVIFFFAQKLPNQAPMLNKLMQLKRDTAGIATKYLVTVNGGLGGSPQPLGNFYDFAAKI